MSWPRGSLFAALLALAIPLAHADTITVNTTTDDNASNSLCSLREAVEYFNQLKTAGTNYQGCTATTGGGTNTISLPVNSVPYAIDGTAITIHRTLTINGAGTKPDAKTSIKVNGNHRAFVIASNPTYLPPACAATSSCQPPGAPALTAVSDNGDSTTDFLTSYSSPSFVVTLPATFPTGKGYRVRLYATPVGGDRVELVSQDLDSRPALGTVTLATILRNGEYKVTSTLQAYDLTTLATDPEGAESPATTLRGYVVDTQQLVTLTKMEINGCQAAAGCANNIDGTTPGYPLSNGLSYEFRLANTAGNGGVIYTDQALFLNGTVIHDGVADRGGAAYAGPNGVFQLSAAELSKNTAQQGAGLYIEKMSLAVLSIQQSLFAENVVTGTGTAAAVVTIAAPASTTSGLADGTIVSSTFSGNTGRALSLQSGITLNGDTIVLNTGGGVAFNGGNGAVYNTIIAGNNIDAGAVDCSNIGTVLFSHNLFLTGSACTGTAGEFISNTGTQTLMAVNDANGKCVGDASGNGLLCPLADFGGDTRSHLPRLLSSYTNVSDSPIVAKGIGSGTGACISPDQRALKRHSLCDVGAVESQIISSTVLAGGDILYGQTFTDSLHTGLDDEELLRACPSTPPVPSSEQAYQYDPSIPGCPWLSVRPGRGTVVFNSDGSYTYTPSSNYHGFDRFTMRVMTTRSKLNSEAVSQSRVLSAQINLAPPSGISSDKTAGALDGWELLLMGGLLLRLRSRREGV